MAFEDIAARVALELGLPAEDERVAAAVDAAILVAERYCYGTTPAPDPRALPLEDPAVSAGLVSLAVRIHLDPRSPAGALESDQYTGAILPADLLESVHAYFDPFRTADGFGVA